jgi:hypothetical protein
METMFKIKKDNDNFSCIKLCELSESLCAFMLTEKRIAIELKELCKRLANSSKVPTSAFEIMENIRIISKKVPDWCTICHVDNIEYFRFLASDIWEAVQKVPTIQKYLKEVTQ